MATYLAMKSDPFRDQVISLAPGESGGRGDWRGGLGRDSATPPCRGMADRLVHHADVLSLKGNSYRLKDRDIGRTLAAATG
ncbi:hypothetical protein GCM10010406_11560 [Streptomyces thermolineatus]|uniref:IstB-like ATP-binding domain-containing protein n=1 Tax=Streptomyces thermolineatus TaxID=44033 RepID=A0ABN3L6N8_9ACTN